MHLLSYPTKVAYGFGQLGEALMAAGFATLSSMFADIVDACEPETDERPEGSVSATRSLAVRATSTTGLVVGGWFLDVIAFPKGARSGASARFEGEL